MGILIWFYSPLRRRARPHSAAKGSGVPHIVIECSDNMRARSDLPGLVDCVHAAALSTGVFPEGGLRTRLAERRHYRIADGDPANGFVHVVVRMGAGRDAATKRRAGEEIFGALCAYLEPVIQTSPLGVSLEVQEIDPELSFKKNNLHEYVRRRRPAAC